MSKQNRRVWQPEQKLQIVEEARQTGQGVSEVCRRHQIAPTLFYQWERQARAGALSALRPQKPGRKPAAETERLEAELTRLRTAITELTLENLELKRGPWR